MQYRVWIIIYNLAVAQRAIAVTKLNDHVTLSDTVTIASYRQTIQV